MNNDCKCDNINCQKQLKYDESIVIKDGDGKLKRYCLACYNYLYGKYGKD